MRRLKRRYWLFYAGESVDSYFLVHNIGPSGCRGHQYLVNKHTNKVVMVGRRIEIDSANYNLWERVSVGVAKAALKEGK